MTFHAFTEYLKYRWRAMGRHGTHSPFVYDLVEKGLQEKGRRPGQNTAFTHPDAPGLMAQEEGTLQTRILRHFEIRSLVYCSGPGVTDHTCFRVQETGGRLFMQRDGKATDALQSFFIHRSDRPPFRIDLLELNPQTGASVQRMWEVHQPLLSPETIVMIDGIHRAAPDTRAWDTIRTSGMVRMSIDLYQVGLLLFRDEFLVKQHFVLKHWR